MKKTVKFSIFLLFFLSAGAIVFAHGWKAPEIEGKRTNPLAKTEPFISAGQDLFTDLCSNCHGEDARGIDDPEMNSFAPPNLIKRLKNHSDGDFFWKIQTGRNEMPAFNEELSDDETWKIILFLNHLAKEQ